MLLHSAIQGVHLASCQKPYFPLNGKTPWFPESYFQRNAIFLHGNVEDRIRSVPFIFHINYGPCSRTSVQRVSARTLIKGTKNFSGKTPPGDPGKLPSDFVDSWNCWISCVPLTSCPPLSQDCSTHLSDKTWGTISDTILRRYGFCSRDQHKVSLQATPQTKARVRVLASVTLQRCGAKGHVVTTLDLVCTDMEHTTSEISLVCLVPNLEFPDTTSNTRTGFLEGWSMSQACHV